MLNRHMYYFEISHMGAEVASEHQIIPCSLNMMSRSDLGPQGFLPHRLGLICLSIIVSTIGERLSCRSEDTVHTECLAEINI